MRKLQASEALQPIDHLSVVDESNCGCGAKFSVLLVTPAFDGVPLLARHRAVNAALEAEVPLIHALSMKTYTPVQWAKKKSEA